ncbi:MAG TPA: S-ribosylhomocysteine lyase, partial [Candidatus Faeciplasma avium]|nr:S-ribosylhomocysteine lyase [Candidatus Faeciplasma avium]
MKLIESFKIDHLRLLPGLYLSRRDRMGDCVVS